MSTICARIRRLKMDDSLLCVFDAERQIDPIMLLVLETRKDPWSYLYPDRMRKI